MLECSELWYNYIKLDLVLLIQNLILIYLWNWLIYNLNPNTHIIHHGTTSHNMKALDSFNSYPSKNPNPKQGSNLRIINPFKKYTFHPLAEGRKEARHTQWARIQSIGATVENVSWFPSPKRLETKAYPP